MVNVICGHILTALAGEEPVFHLSPPHIRAEHGELASDARTIAFRVEEEPVLLRFTADDSA
jgi:hypothetical protein